MPYLTFPLSFQQTDTTLKCNVFNAFSFVFSGENDMYLLCS